MKGWNKKQLAVIMVFFPLFLVSFSMMSWSHFTPGDFQPEIVLCTDNEGLQKLGTQCLSKYEPYSWGSTVVNVMFLSIAIGFLLLGLAESPYGHPKKKKNKILEKEEEE